MNLSTRLLSLFLPLLLLTACARPDGAHLLGTGLGCAPPPAMPLGENGMLRYARCLSTLPPAKLAAEYDRVNHHFQQGGSGSDRVKLAMLLSVPDTAFHSSAAALRLLAPAPHDARRVPAGLHDLAEVLGLNLRWQLAAEQKMHGLQKDLAAEKLHAGALQVKIDSVKNLERTMTQRDTP